LLAQNYCNFTPSNNSFGPLQVYDRDNASITPDKPVRCWPDNNFTFTNSTNRNCLAQGNTFQRQEKWNFGNYWGLGHDSIIGWQPWPPTSPISITYTSTGFYQVSLLDSNLCGVTGQTIGVNIVNAPSAGIVAPSATICQNSSVTFTNSSTPGAYQYKWNFGTGGGFTNLGAGNKSHAYTIPGTYTVTLVVLIPGTGSSCSDTTRTVINVLPSPIAAFAATPNSGCNGINNVFFNDFSSGAVLWDWNFGNGNTSTLNIPPLQNYTTTGIFTASLLVTSPSGCVNQTTGTLIARANPVPDFVTFSACAGQAVTFTNISSPLTGTAAITNYTWNFGDQAAVSTASAPVHTYSAQGTYSVKLYAQGPFCSDSVIKAVTVNVKPTASFAMTPSGTGCTPLAVTFSNSSLNSTQVTWDLGASSATSSLSNPNFTYSNATQNPVTVTVTLIAGSGAGCADTTVGFVNVLPKPVAGFTNNFVSSCSGFVTTFSSTSTGATSYSYNFGDGGTSTLAGPNHIYTNTGLFTQTITAILTVTNNFGCLDTTSKLMTIYPAALTTFSMVPDSGCSPLNVTFQSVPGVAIYSWDHGDGSPTFTTTTAHNWIFTNTGTSNLPAFITLTAQTSNGCVGTGTGSVLVFNNPVANFTNNLSSGCSPITVTFSNTSTGHTTSLWNFDNGTTSSQLNPVSTFTNAAGNASHTYHVKLKVITTFGCADSVTKAITLEPQPKSGFDMDSAGCAPKTVQFQNLSTGVTAYRWDFGDGSASALANVQHLYGNSSLINKTYVVKLVVTSSNNCKDSSTRIINIHPKPEWFIAASPEQGCSLLTVTFPEVAGAVQYQWKYDNVGFGDKGNITNTFENKGSATKTYTVELVAKDIFQCADTAIKLIRVFPSPTAKFSAHPLSIFIPDDPVTFTNESTRAAKYDWHFGDGETSAGESPTHTYQKADEYQVILIVTSSNGCRDTFALPEKIVALEESKIEVPNAFTPNLTGSRGRTFDPKDLSNDIFHPNIKGADKYVLSIYSRWGELLFETKNPDEGWDGYYKGKLCTQDVYIWKVIATFIDGKSINKTGEHILLR
jgi:gliding motility-associated-like protein